MNGSRVRERPLGGLRVMVTRPQIDCRVGRAERVPPEPAGDSGGDDLAGQLRQLGAEVVLQPAIRIAAPADWRPVDAALARLAEFDWLVFSSANGVRYLLDRASEKGASENGTQLFSAEGAAKRAASPFLAAIGPGTAEELARHGLRANLVPEQFRAEALADALAREARGRRFLLARASRGREVLAEQLRAAGATVEQIVVYSSTDVERPDPAVTAALRAGQIDWITVTSSAIARSLRRLFGEDLRRAKLASISPLTSGALRELGASPAVEAAAYTMAGLVAAIVNASFSGRTDHDSRSS